MGNATRKQIDALRKMGYSVAEDISFEDASALFDQHKQKGQAKKEVPLYKSTASKFHLTIEQVRYNALDIVLRKPGMADTMTVQGLLKEAEFVEQWMLR